MQCLLVTLLALAAPLLDDTALVPFEVPPVGAWDNITNLARLTPAPAGESGFVTIRDGHFVDGAGQRLRFMGGALAFGANFPEHAAAEQLAARLQMLGINLVRLHHMDMGTTPRGLWRADRADRQHLDAAQLDRLDYLAAQLKARGVYLNLNLHVSRKFGEADGFPEADKLPKMDKGVDNYEPRMIELQQTFAREMLNRVNPYTGRRWADETALAMVEINNENSLLDMALKGDLADLPERYIAPLQESWNVWLRAKYGTTDKLRTGWGVVNQSAGGELLRNGDFAAGPEQWSIQSSDLVAAERSAAGPGGQPCLNVTFGSPGPLAWSHQLHQTGLALEPGKVYTATYAMRAEQTATVATAARLDHAHPQTGRFEMVGPSDTITVTPQWQTYRYTFVASTFAGPGCRLGFTFPNAKGTYQLAAMSLRLGGTVGLDAGETLEAGTVPVPLGGAQLLPTRLDFANFLIDVERDYTGGMARLLKEELGVKCPVIDTQASYGGVGGLLREARLDYVDMHGYWQHPHYTPKPGGGQTFTIQNTPMVASEGGILLTLARHRLRGKAFCVSEFNHAAPSYYQAEAWPMMAAFAARQDWDGIVIHNYLNYGSEEWQPGHANNLFDTATNPAKAVFLPAAALLFRTAAVPPAAAETVLRLPEGQVPELLATGAGDLAIVWSVAGLGSATMLDRRLAVELVPGNGEPAVSALGEAEPGPVSWDRSDLQRPRFTVNVPQAAVATGYLSGRPLTLGAVTLELQPTQSGCATVAVTAMDGQPLAASHRILVAGLGRTINSGATWREDGQSLLQWGGPPTLIEPLAGVVRLKTTLSHKAWRLDGAGNRGPEARLTREADAEVLVLDPSDQTAWYELAAD